MTYNLKDWEKGTKFDSDARKFWTANFCRDKNEYCM